MLSNLTSVLDNAFEVVQNRAPSVLQSMSRVPPPIPKGTIVGVGGLGIVTIVKGNHSLCCMVRDAGTAFVEVIDGLIHHDLCDRVGSLVSSFFNASCHALESYCSYAGFYLAKNYSKELTNEAMLFNFTDVIDNAVKVISDKVSSILPSVSYVPPPILFGVGCLAIGMVVKGNYSLYCMATSGGEAIVEVIKGIRGGDMRDRVDTIASSFFNASFYALDAYCSYAGFQVTASYFIKKVKEITLSK